MRKFSLLLITCFSLVACTPPEDPTAATIDVESITLNETEVPLEVGQTLELTAIINPKDATDKTLTWSIDDDKVLSVEEGTSLFTALAPGEAVITARAKSGVKAECVVTVSGEDGDKRAIEYTNYYSVARLDAFESPLYHWSLDLSNEEARESSLENYEMFTERGYGIELDFYMASQSYTYEFPTGEFSVIGAVDDNADNKMRVKYVKYGSGGTRVETILTEGSVNITKDDNGKFALVFDVHNSSIEYKSTVNIDTKEPTLYASYNEAYNTTIAEDLISDGTEFTQVKVCRSADVANSYEVFLATEGITLHPAGNYSGSGKFLQLWLTADNVKGNPNGTYTITAGADAFSPSKGDFTATSGSLSPFGSAMGSWWFDVVEYTTSYGTARRQVSAAPLVTGTVELEVSDVDIDSDYKPIALKIRSADDKLPTSNNIEFDFTGECFYYDRYDTGDFFGGGCGFMGIYGNEQGEDGQFFYYKDNGSGDNTNWFVRLSMGNDVVPGGGEIMIDMMASPSARFRDGIPNGTFTFDGSRSYDEMTIFNSIFWPTVAAGETMIEYKAKSGSITFEKTTDDTERYNVSVDITYENGTRVKGDYKGLLMAQNLAEVPISSHVFNGEDARIDITYLGQVGGKSNWAVEMLEDTAVDENGQYDTGLILSFDLMLDNHLYADGVPTGRFDLYNTIKEGDADVDDPTKFGICNNYETFYSYLYQSAGSDRRIGWTTGAEECYIEIVKNGENDYSIEVEMHSQGFIGNEYIDYSVTGNYTGAVSLGENATYSSPASSAPEASEQPVISKYKK